jgi:hypothetical protein
MDDPARASDERVQQAMHPLPDAELAAHTAYILGCCAGASLQYIEHGYGPPLMNYASTQGATGFSTYANSIGDVGKTNHVEAQSPVLNKGAPLPLHSAVVTLAQPLTLAQQVVDGMEITSEALHVATMFMALSQHDRTVIRRAVEAAYRLSGADVAGAIAERIVVARKRVSSKKKTPAKKPRRADSPKAHPAV